jgi:Na+-transporting NADH:ubiquinone oxidoreductase subunit NqrF
MINDLLINKHETRPIRLHWGLKNEANMFWFDNFERLMGDHPNFVFDPVLSQPGEDWDLCSGHVQDCLRRDFAQKGLSDWEGYVCGSPKMVEEVCALLPQLGMKNENVHHEKFT